MDSPQQLKITSITLTMEGETVDAAVAASANVSIAAAPPNDELEWVHRFKVVKVYGEPYRRGRFLCYDYKEPDEKEIIKQNDAKEIDDKVPSEDSAAHDEGTSGQTEGVAIDNKIEQAMDLVKSHLMFAVREEVDVLKERITELLERINALESENALLRQHIDEKTLSTLINGHNQQNNNQSPNGGS